VTPSLGTIGCDSSRPPAGSGREPSFQRPTASPLGQAVRHFSSREISTAGLPSGSRIGWPKASRVTSQSLFTGRGTPNGTSASPESMSSLCGAARHEDSTHRAVRRYYYRPLRPDLNHSTATHGVKPQALSLVTGNVFKNADLAGPFLRRAHRRLSNQREGPLHLSPSAFPRLDQEYP
jgi:hypothetical protein